jgi:hypothetical protein
MNAEKYVEKDRFVYLCIGNLCKPDFNGKLKPKACQELMKHLIFEMDKLLGFDFSTAFTIIQARNIPIFGLKNG